MLWAVVFLLSGFTPENQLDINNARVTEIRQLPIDSLTAWRLYQYLELYGRLNSIYDLLKVPGITPEKLDELKPLIYVSRADQEERRTANIQRVQKQLTTEDGPGAAVVEEWQDLLLDPLNINRATVDDLLLLENVSLVDAVAVVKYLRRGGRLETRRDLAGRVEGLSSYGYRGMRDYVKFDDRTGKTVAGNYRVQFATDPGWTVIAGADEFAAALTTLREDSARFREAGYTEAEREFFQEQLQAEQAFIAGMGNQASVRHRLRLRLGRNLRAAGWLMQKFYEPRAVSEYKGFIAGDDLGPVRRLILGDYRLTLGQGLILDNTAELLPRVANRVPGLFGDLSENPGFGLRGIAAELGVSRFGLLAFYSRQQRDAILNPDSTVNFYIVATPRYPTFKGVLPETDIGGSFRLDLSGIGFIPLGSRFGVSVLSSRTGRSFQPQPKFLDLPGDAEVLDDPEYILLDTGKVRTFYGAEFRTVVENLSLEGELARQHRGGQAYLVKARTQYDYLYLTALYRHYDGNYNNPYNRGYCEELRFEDTPLEKPYRLIDPAFAALQDFPMPKPEQGVQLEMRYQISRQITFTRAYIDLWRNIAQGADNLRFQAEVEYRPVLPLRLRWRQKVQVKERPQPVQSTRSLSLESALRAMLSLSNWDFLTGELRWGKTLLTPTMKYNDEASINGDFLSVQWEHNFSDDFSGELGIAAWRCAGMSEWLFEDRGIDFIDGDGFKWYLALTDRIGDNLLCYVKVRHKLSQFSHTGLGNNEGVHYGDGGAVADFITRDSRFDISVQLDVFW